MKKNKIMSFLMYLFLVFNVFFFSRLSLYLTEYGPFLKELFTPFRIKSLYLSSVFLSIIFLSLLVFLFINKRLRLWYRRVIEEFESTIDDNLAKNSILWITTSSVVLLFLELCVIRWMGALIPDLAFYRNFSLLACFLGIGLGFLTSRKNTFFIPLILPLIAFQFLIVSIVANLYSPAMPPPAGLFNCIRSPFLHFLLIVLTMIGPGQLVGRLLVKTNSLKAYGANLFGSIIGILVLNIFAAQWTSPWVWLVFISLIYLAAFHKTKTFIGSFVIFAVFLYIANFTHIPSVFEIYSPYQRISLERYGYGHSLGDGRQGLFSNGRYYQSFSMIDRRKIRKGFDVQHYIPNADLGFVKNSLEGAKILALGSGAGDNIPAFLDAGVASVVAVDIDPTIVYLGKELNANKPYLHPKVKVVVNDARAYLRQTNEYFDYIFFLWIDSQPDIRSSQGFRIDSFVYTQESFEQAKARLKPDGKIFLYAWMNDVSSKKIYKTVQKVFGDNIQTFKVLPYHAQLLYVVGMPEITDTGSPFIVPWEVKIEKGEDIKKLSDDWPFLYLENKPFVAGKFFPFLCIIFGLSFILIFLMVEDWASVIKVNAGKLIVFFLFGVAFMLVETISIMQVALLIGNTWQVTGFVIIAILTMAFIGNYLVMIGCIPTRMSIWVSGLIISLLFCFFVDANMIFSWVGRINTATVVYLIFLSLPIIFSSILFSLLIKDFPEVDKALGANLLGAMLGGCLEYGAMVYGYKAMTLCIPVLYFSAILIWRTNMDKKI